MKSILKSIDWKNIFLNINFYILINFVVGLENILLSPLDDHAWRQTLTISMARNYLEFPNFFFPRIDNCTNTEGIIASEFPLYQYILFIFYKIFGYQDWYGRLLNWVLSSIMLFYFYDILKRISNKNIAFYSTFVIMSSIIFQFARKSMPDAFSMSFIMFGVWLVFQYFENKKGKNLILSFFFITIGLLSKLSYITFLSFLLFPIIDKKIEKSLKIKTTISLTISILLVYIWYFIWVPYLESNYHNPLIYPYSLSEGWKIVSEHIDEAIGRFRFDAFSSSVPYTLSLLGLVVSIFFKNWNYIYFSTIFILISIFLIIKSGVTFYSHTYYVMFCVPLLAFWAGYFISNFPIKSNYIKLLFTFLILYNGFLFNKKVSFNLNENKHLLSLGSIINNYVGKNEKIMINTGMLNPTSLFFANRKGWAVNPDVVKKYTWVPDFKKDGLKYIIIDRKYADDTLMHKLLYEDSNFRVYQP